MCREGMAVPLFFLTALALGAALLEGAGMGFLIPVFESLQHSINGQPSESSVSAVYMRVFRWLGLPFTLPAVLTLGVAIFFGYSFLGYLRVLVAAQSQNKLVVNLRSEAFSNLLDFDLDYFHRTRVGELVSTLSTEASRAGYAFRALVDMVATLCLLVAYAVVELVISWKLAVVAFPVLGAMVVLLRPRDSYQLGVEESKENDNLQSTAVESLGAMREILSLGIGGLVGERFCRSARALGRLSVTYWESSARFTLLYQSLLFAVIGGLVYFTARSGEVPLASLLVFLVVLQRMGPRAGMLAEQRHTWLGSANAMEKVEALLKNTERSKASVISGKVPFHRLERSIEVEGLRFRHAGRTSDTLTGVSFAIPRGKTVAIVGASGAGKSTLIDLLVRFYDPTGGAIRVDGRDLRDLDLASWRRAIGLMSQDTFLFHDTIENNIRCGDVNAAAAAVEEAARRAHAHEFIGELPEGYATVIGDRGVKLSGGQRQRIALARAMLRQPQVLILDEATSNLDSESERHIQEALRTLGETCTIIIVAHRLSTIEHADEILVLEKGTVVEHGTRDSLLARGGRFAMLYQLRTKELTAPAGRS